jgi:hypothetical protein
LNGFLLNQAGFNVEKTFPRFSGGKNRLTKWLDPAAQEKQTELSASLPANRHTVAGTVYEFHVIPYYPDHSSPAPEKKN